jgi:hypothetical protein
MAVNIGGWKKAYITLAAESGRTGNLTFGGLSSAAESEEEAAIMAADAGIDAAEISQGQVDVDATLKAAGNADAAGDGFAGAAAVQPENIDSAQQLVAQADIMAQDTADDMGVAVSELLPEIPDDDRQAVTVESGTGRYISRKMYAHTCSDRRILTRCSESLFDAAKALVGSAWDKLVKLWRQFCQWVDKYVGTYPRLLKAVLAMKSRAKDIEGKRKEDSKLDITSSVKMLAVPKENGSAEPEYLTKANDLVRFVEVFAKTARSMVDDQKKMEAKVTDFAQELNGADFSTVEDAKKSLDAIIDPDDALDLEVGGKNWASYPQITGGKYKDRAGVVVREMFVLPGYQRVIVFGPSEQNVGDRFSDMISKFGIEFVNGDPDSKKEIKPNVSFEVMTQSQIEDVCDALKRPLEEIIAYRSGRSYLKGEVALKRMRDGADKVKARAQRGSESDDANRESREAGKAAIEYANLMIKMTALPMKIIERFKTYAEMCLTLCGKSINAYTAQK